MQYEGPLYRPPSEAYSLIVQITIGCSHNKCNFCTMYKTKSFRIRSLDEILADLTSARQQMRFVDKIFLADGDALIIPTSDLLTILHKIKEIFPECKRVTIYGSPKAINKKSVSELEQLKNAGLAMVYMGLESGNEEILKDINKGVTAAEMIQAGQKVKKAGILLSITVISGIGGREKIEQHARDTALVLNQIDPEYLGLLTLMLVPGTELYEQNQQGKFSLITPPEVMMETKIMLENLQLTNCVFRANHASNYIPLAGTLPQDKERLLQLINKTLNAPQSVFKEEYMRGL